MHNLDDFIEVAVKATGEKQQIPVHWLDNPVFAEQFRELPSATAAKGKAKSTGEATTPNNAPKSGEED